MGERGGSCISQSQARDPDTSAAPVVTQGMFYRELVFLLIIEEHLHFTPRGAVNFFSYFFDDSLNH